METYIQKIVPRIDSEAYIIAGCYGDKGKIKNKIIIPTNCYKIAVIMPEGSNDLQRITKDTKVITVDMPNESNNKSGWKNYITTVDDLESITGYDFLSTLSDEIESALEAKKDN